MQINQIEWDRLQKRDRQLADIAAAWNREDEYWRRGARSAAPTTCALLDALEATTKQVSTNDNLVVDALGADDE